MNIDWTISVGNVGSFVTLFFFGGVAFSKVTSELKFIGNRLGELSRLPETVARQDERLKFLEK